MRHEVQVLSIAVAIATVAAPCFGQHEEHRRNPDLEPERMYWQMPLRVLEEIGVAPGMRVADVGAGDGYFTLRLAKAVGSGGEVFASDIDARALQRLEERRRSAGVQNVRIVHGTQDDPLLPGSAIDLVLIVNTIHLVDDPPVFLENVRRSLKPGGTVVFVQWSAEKMEFEAPEWDETDRAKYTLRTTLRTIYEGGLELVRLLDFLPMQYIYICEARTQ